MAHMVDCLMIGGPFDSEIVEVNDQRATVEYDADLKPLELAPIAQDMPVANTRMYRHVYRREDANSFIYAGFM